MVAISDVSISNMALSHIGASSTIASLTEASAEAKAAERWYDVSRIQALEAFNWAFARKRLTLASDSEAAPAGVWLYRYQYPADGVSVREICNPLGPSADAVPFTIELSSDGLRKTILTDQDAASIVYTKDLELAPLFSMFFVETLSYLMAHHMAFQLTGKIQLRQQMLEMYNLLIQQAPAVDANESVDRPKREAPWVRSRGHTRNGSEVT